MQVAWTLCCVRTAELSPNALEWPAKIGPTGPQGKVQFGLM